MKNACAEFVDSHQSNLDKIVDKLYEDFKASQSTLLSDIYSNSQGFLDRNYKRWKDGFDRLRLFHHYCIETGQAFQEEFLKYPQFTNDPLLGVLMHFHARACRITGEVITLLINGYADGALSRWRTLHEIAVTAMVISNYGREAAEDYTQYGLLQSVEDMKSYQETALSMGRQPYSKEELEEALQIREEILEKYGNGFLSSNAWARKYVGGGKFDKLRKDVGLEKWSNDYKMASRDIHTDFREMKSLFAMSEADQEILLCGPSNSGMVEPAHCTAIALTQITATFVFTYLDEENSPIDYKKSMISMKLIRQMSKDIGNTFLDIHKRTYKRPRQSLADIIREVL